MPHVSADFEPLPAERADDVFTYLDDRFGLGRAVFAGHRFWHRPGSPALWIAAAALRPPAVGAVSGMGLCAFRDPPPRGKPSNVFFQRFGRAATRGVWELPEAHASAYLAGASLVVDDLSTRGWVLVRSGGQVLGRGWLERGCLKGELKRAWREGLGGVSRDA